MTTRTTRLALASLLFSALLAAGPAGAEGNLASKPTKLAPLVMNKDLSMSVKQYELTTGKYYRWQVESKGGEEFQLRAPDLFRNSWVDQIVTNGIEVKPMGGVYGIEFDDPGATEIWFVPIRPGDYEFYVAGQRERGMLGKFIVR
jgi:hypothetical protein